MGQTLHHNVVCVLLRLCKLSQRHVSQSFVCCFFVISAWQIHLHGQYWVQTVKLKTDWETAPSLIKTNGQQKHKTATKHMNPVKTWRGSGAFKQKQAALCEIQSVRMSDERHRPDAVRWQNPADVQPPPSPPPPPLLHVQLREPVLIPADQIPIVPHAGLLNTDPMRIWQIRNDKYRTHFLCESSFKTVCHRRATSEPLLIISCCRRWAVGRVHQSTWQKDPHVRNRSKWFGTNKYMSGGIKEQITKVSLTRYKRRDAIKPLSDPEIQMELFTESTIPPASADGAGWGPTLMKDSKMVIHNKAMQQLWIDSRNVVMFITGTKEPRG